MSSDPNRTLGHQALFARFLAAHVMEYAIAAGEEGVRNDLLVGRIGIRRGAGQEVIISARQDGLEIALRFEVQSVEAAELVEETSPNDEDIFVKRTHFPVGALKGKGRTDLWPKEVETRVRIGLPAI